MSAIVLAFATLTGLLSGCGEAVASHSPSTAPIARATASSSAAVSLDPTAAPPSTSAGRTFPPSQTAIEPGTYRWDGFEPAISLAIGPGWQVGHRHPEFFDLFQGGDFPAVSFGRFDEVYQDAANLVAATDAQTVLETFRARPDLTISAIDDVDLGGLSGRQFELASGAVQASLFRGPTGSLRMDPGFENLYRLLDVPGGGVLMVGVNARAGGLEAAQVLADPILASLTFER